MNKENKDKTVQNSEATTAEGENYQDENNEVEDYGDDPFYADDIPINESEIQGSATESDLPSETKPEELVTKTESDAECVEEEPLPTDSDVIEVEPVEKPEIKDAGPQSGDSPKEQRVRNPKAIINTPKDESCDNYGWPISSKYSTGQKNVTSGEQTLPDVDLNSSDGSFSKKPNHLGEVILYEIKSPSHKTQNTKRTVIKVNEVEGAITEGLSAGTHLPLFLNYLSWQVKFKLTVLQEANGNIKIVYRFIGKNADALRNILLLWLKREDEDKDKLIFEGLTRSKEDTIEFLGDRFEELENLHGDPIALYEEIKKLVPHCRGKGGLRSKDPAFLTAYKNLDKKLKILNMLLFKEGCGSKENHPKILKRFQELFTTIQLQTGFTVRQYLFVIYYYNLIFAPFLPNDLPIMMKNYARLKNLQLSNTPLIVPPGGQKVTNTVINPFAKKSAQGQENATNENAPKATVPKKSVSKVTPVKESRYAEYEMVPVKTKAAVLPKTAQSNLQMNPDDTKKQPKKRNRKFLTYRANTVNIPGQRILPGQRNIFNPRSNLRRQPVNQNPQTRRNVLSQRNNLVKQTNVQNLRNLKNSAMQKNPASLGNPANKRRQGTQGGLPTKKRPLNRVGTENLGTLANPVASANKKMQEKSASQKNQPNQSKVPNQRSQQNPRRLPRQRNQQNEQPRNNQPNQRSNQPVKRNNQPNQRNNQPNQRNNQPNQRNNQPNQRNNQPNQRNNQPNQRNNQPNPRNEKNNLPNERGNQSRNSRSRRRPDFRRRNSNDQFFGMSDMSRNQNFVSSDHEFLLNSLRNQDLMQNNMRNQDMGRSPDMGRNQNFNNRNHGFNMDRNQIFNMDHDQVFNMDRDQGFSQSNSRNQNFSQGNFSQDGNPRSLFSQQFFDQPRNQNFSPNNSSSPNFSQSNSRRGSVWATDFPGSSQNFFSGSNSFSNRSNSMNRNSGDMAFSNFSSRMSFDDDINWNDGFNRAKRKMSRDDWINKRPKQGT